MSGLRIFSIYLFSSWFFFIHSFQDLGRQMLDAAKDGHTDQVRLLMANGAPFTADWLGINPLHVSCQYGHLETTELLLHAGISRDAKTKVERTPLHFAAQEGHIEIVDLLICSGADIEAKDMLKMTPLHWAVEREHIGIIELLLMHGADVHCLNKFDKSPIDIAVSNGRADIAEMLQTTRQNVIEVTTSEIAMEEEAAIAELVNSEEGVHQELVSPVVTHTPVPLATLPVTDVTKPAPSYVRITTPMIVQPRVVKKEPIIIKARPTDKKPANAAMLGRLGTAASGLAETVNWSDANAETLNWLEVNAVNQDNTSSIISSSLEHGQTLALTEAGKLALNFVRRHLPKAASASSMEATRTVELKTMAQEHDIELGGEEVNTDEVATPDDDLGVEVGVPAKKMRVSELLVDSSKPEDLRRQLEEAQREALAYRQQLQRKEREAEVYKKQLTQVTSKGTTRS